MTASPSPPIAPMASGIAVIALDVIEASANFAKLCTAAALVAAAEYIALSKSVAVGATELREAATADAEDILDAALLATSAPRELETVMVKPLDMIIVPEPVLIYSVTLEAVAMAAVTLETIEAAMSSVADVWADTHAVRKAKSKVDRSILMVLQLYDWRP